MSRKENSKKVSLNENWIGRANEKRKERTHSRITFTVLDRMITGAYHSIRTTWDAPLARESSDSPSTAKWSTHLHLEPLDSPATAKR